MTDTFDLVGKQVLLNALLRGGRGHDGNPQIIIYGFALNLPSGIMEKSDGLDVRVILQCEITGGGSVTCKMTEYQSPEDTLERGLPAFADVERRNVE